MALNYLDKAALDAGVYKDKGNDDDTQQDTSSEDSGYSASGILSAAKNFLEHPFQGTGTVIAPNYTPRPLDDSVYSDIPGTPVASGQFGELEDESVRDERMKDSADYMAANWPRLYGGVVAADEGLANVVGGIQNAVGGGNGILTNVQRAEEGMQNYRDQWNNEYGDSYFLNPNKFATDVGSGIGSTVPIMALSALMPGAAVAGGTRALTSALSRAGLGRLAMSEAGQALIADTVRSPISSLADSLSEYGTVVNDMMQNGMSEDEARRRAIPMFFKNMALDTFTVPLELGVMKGGKGIATGLLGRSAGEGMAKSIAKGAARTGMLAGASGLTEGYQEGAQNALENDVEGNRDGGWYNPLTWTNEDWEAARGGFVGGALMGVPGNVAAGFHPEARQAPLSAEPQEQAQSIKDTLSHGKPAGMSNAAYNAYIELANSGNPDLIKQAASSLESFQQSQEGSQGSTDDAATEAYNDYETYDQKQEIENFLDNNTVEQIGGEKNFNWLWGVLHNGTPEEVQHAYDTVIAAEKATAEQEAKNRPVSGGGSMSPNTGNAMANIVIQAANDSGVEPRLGLAIAARESGGDDVNAISMPEPHDGVYGVMQAQEETVSNMGLDSQYPDWKTDPYQNAMVGMAILKAKIDGENGDVWAGVRDYDGAGEEAEQYRQLVKNNYDNMGDIGGGGSGNVEAPSEAFYDLSEAMNPQVDGMDPNTMAKMNLLARDFYQKYGHRLLVTSLKRNGDGSSYHDEGHAFDFSDDFLEQNPDARDWLVQQGEKYGLKGLDEFSHPVATTDGGNVHFTDHGGPAPGGASSGVSGKVTSDNGQFERELDQAAQEAKSDMDKIQAQSNQAMNEIMNDDSTEKTAQDAQQDAENAQKQAEEGQQSVQDDVVPDVAQTVRDTSNNIDEINTLDGMFTKDSNGNDKFIDTPENRDFIKANYKDEITKAVNDAMSKKKAPSATPLPKTQQQTPHARLGRILSTYDRKDPKFKEYMNTFRNGTEQEQQKLADDLQTTQELERANSLKGNPLTTQQDQNIPQNVPRQAVEAPKQTEQVNTPVQAKESLETQKKRKIYLAKKQKLMERVPAGKTVKVHASTNDAGFDATYKIVPAGDITASHDMNYAVNDLYPAEYQPRDRNRPQMRGQVEKMTKGMKPELLAESQFVNEGAPVINNSGVVLNGNGRVMAVQKAYKGLADAHKKSAKAYKGYLVSIAPSLGIAPEKVQSMEHPVLVRQAADDADTSAIINSTEGGAKLGGAEQAKADADRLKLSTLEQFVDNGTGEFMNPSNREFRRAAASDVFSDAEGNSVFNEKGDLSPTGAFRIRNAIFAKAYNDNYLLTQLSEATDNNSKNIMNAMIAAAPEVAKVNEGIKNGALYPDYDISDVITKTAKTIMSLRNEGKPLSFHLQETDLFSQGGLEAERLVLEFIERNKFKSRTIADMYKGACDRIFAVGSPKQSRLFDSKEAPRISLENIISNAIQEVEHGQSLFDTTEEKPAEKTVSEVPDNRQAEPAGSGRAHQQEAGRVQSQEKEGNEVDEKSKQSDHVDAEPQQTESKDKESTHAEEGSQSDVQEEVSKFHNVLDDEKSTPKQVIDAYKSVVDKVIANANGSRKNAKIGDKIVTDEYQSLTNSKHWNAFMNEDGGRNWHEVATINADAHKTLRAIIKVAGVKFKEAPSSQGIAPYKQAVDDIMDKLAHKKLTPAQAINKLKTIMKDANAARWGEFKAMEAIESKEKLSFDDYKMALDLANDAMKKANDMRLEASRKRKARKTEKELESATEETNPAEQSKEKAGFTDDEINTLTDRGFKRWTKKLSNGKVMDRLYIKPEYLGLELTRYKSGNISSATFNGERISNSEARRIEGTKCYVDVATKEVVCDREDLKQAAQEVVNDALSKEKSKVLAQTETKKAVPKDDVKTIKKSLLNLATKVWQNPRAQGKVTFYPSQKLKDKVKELFGHDIDTVFITADDIRHIKSGHPEHEESRGQINLSEQDIPDIYDVVNDFDNATKLQSDAKGNQKIMFVKDVNGKMISLLIERGKHKAQVKTAYKKQVQMSDVTSPEPNVLNDSVPAFTSIISQKAEKGNKPDELRNQLSNGGKQAYDYAFDKLSQGHEKVAQSAKESAFIYARMAERWSEIMHEYGNKTYSPEDYTKSHPIVMGQQSGNAQLERAFEQRAWHGSGIDFDNFDLGKIGSGTGASMHGWGIYAAKSKRTAQKYKKEMKDRGLPSVLYEIDVPANKELLDEDKRYKDQMKGVQTKILKAVQSLSVEQKQAFWTKWLRQAMGSTKGEIQAETALRKVELNIKHCHDASLGWEGLPAFRKRIALNSLKKQGYTDEQINDTSYMESESKRWEKELPGVQQQAKEAKGAGDKKRNQLIEAAMENPEATLEKGIGTGKEIYNYLTDALSDGKDMEKTSKYLNEQGIHGITYDDAYDGRCYVVFDDKAIQIIDKYNQDVHNAKAAYDASTGAIRLFDIADQSSFIHESAHMFLSDMERLAQKKDAPAGLVSDLQTVKDWAGYKPGQMKGYKGTALEKEFQEYADAIREAKKTGDAVAIKSAEARWMHERFARGFERYIADGKAPNESLKNVFEKFKEWMVSIYQDLKNLGKKPPKEIQDVMARMITPKTDTKYSAREAHEQLTRSKEDLKAEIKEAFPNAKEIKDEGDRMTFTMPNGSHIVVDVNNEILLTDEELAQAKKDHHIDDNGNVVVEGYAQLHGKDAYMALSQGSRENTGFHEAYHLAEGAVLTDREKAAIKKAIPDAEKRADKYAEWVEARKHGRGTAWGKLFQKIKDFAAKMKRILTRTETVNDIFRQIESGKVWERDARDNNERRYAARQEDQEEAPVKPQDIIDAINDIVHIYEGSRLTDKERKELRESSKFDPDQKQAVRPQATDLYDRHAHAGFNRMGYFNLSNYGRILALHLDNIMQLKGNLELANKVLDRQDKNAAENKMNGVNEHLTPAQARQNAVMDFGAMMIRNPELARETYPAYSKIFDEGLEQHPDLKEKLDKVIQLNETYQGQTAAERAAGSIAREKEKVQLRKHPKEWLSTHFDKFYTNWVDDKHAFAKVVARAEAELGRKLAYDYDVHKQAQMAINVASSRALLFLTGGKGVEETYKVLNKVYGHAITKNVTMKDVMDALNKVSKEDVSKTGAENAYDALGNYLIAMRTEELEKHYHDAYARSAGFDEEGTREIIQNTPESIKKIAQMYWDINTNIVNILQQQGLISKDLAGKLRKYKHYCPMYRDMSDGITDMDEMIGTIGVFNKGGGYANVSNGIKRIEGGGKRPILDPITSLSQMAVSMISKCERNDVAKTFIKLGQDFAGLGDVVVRDPTLKHADPTAFAFAVWQNGEKVVYRTTPEIYDALTNNDAQTNRFTIKMASSIAQTLRTGATISPSFIVRNLLRDTMSATVNSKTGFYLPFVDNVRGAWKLHFDKEFSAEYHASGASMSTYMRADADSSRDLTKELLGHKYDSYPVIVKQVRQLISYAWHKYEKFGNLIEDSTRAGEFRRARNQGLSIDQAGQLAREITLDFSRHGKKGQIVNKYVPFFNATIQGTDKFIRTFKDNPMRAILNTVIWIILPSLGLWAINHDDDWYKELDENTKYTNWAIPLPGGTHLLIPKPQEVGILFGSGIEAVLNQMTGTDPHGMKEWARQYAEAMTPSLYPAVVRPLIEWMTNYSFWTGRNLVPASLQKAPSEMQFTSYTSELAKSLGDTWLAKSIKLSPIAIDNWISGWFGSAGRFIANMLNDPISYVRGNSRPPEPAKYWYEMPVIGSFVRQNGQNSEYVNRMYEIQKDMNDDYERSDAGKQRKGKKSSSNKPKELKQVDTAVSSVSKLNKEIKAIRNDPKKDPDRKRQEIDQRQTKINDLAKKVVLKFDK